MNKCLVSLLLGWLFFVMSVHADDKMDCSKNKPIKASIVELLSNKEKYSGVCIQTFGVLNVGFESNLIFLNKESYDNYLTVNAIRLRFMKESYLEKYSNIKGRYVIVEGVYTFYQGRGEGYERVVDNIIKLEGL